MINSSANKIFVSGGFFIGFDKPAGRVDKSYFDTTIQKLKFVTNKMTKNSILFVTGPLVNKRFDVRVLSSLIEILKDKNVYVVADKYSVKGSGEIDSHSTIGLLESAGVVKILKKSGVVEGARLKCNDGLYSQVVFDNKDTAITNQDLLNYNLNKDMGVILIAGTEVVDSPNIGNGKLTKILIKDTGNQVSNSVHTIVRQYREDEAIIPSYLDINSKLDVKRVEVPFNEHVFDQIIKKSNGSVVEKSQFVENLNLTSKIGVSGKSIDKVLDDIMKSKNISSQVFDIVENTKLKTSKLF